MCGSTEVRLGRPEATSYPPAGRPRDAKLKCAEASAGMDPGRTTHSSLRTLSRASAGTHAAASATPGNVKRVCGGEGHPEARARRC